MDARKIAQAICPGIVHAQVPYTNLLRRLLVTEAHWLDLGCGHQAIRPRVLLPDEDEIVITQRPSFGIGIDQDLAALRRNISMPLRVAGDIHNLPFAGASFDVITANMVLEHVHDPQALLNEVGRVLRPGGIFMFLTPNKYFPMTIIASLIPDKVKVPIVELITNRREHDIYPTQYRINTHASISEFARAAGFDIDRVELVETLTYNPHRLVFLFNLGLAWLLRRHALRNLRAVFLVLLRKPGAHHTSESLVDAREEIVTNLA